MSLNIKLKELKDEISSVIITEIDIDDISRNLDLLNYIILNLPLNIKYNKNILTYIENLKKCDKCKKNADYKYNDIFLCWNCSL